ncbi:YcfA-like protein [Moorella thermoacetica]|uniref:YcfA-like protein n=1 Tax=Neomoorella thermoacetica TaxID=1525 RepID=A0A1J5JVL7_NEOTH|nr:type II toxin-antitoxin system HicA family toxin [Moorella thermoacetica]OIQ07625.1 YcfA-like protein [Moorella thermoacetica]OIQ07630.1 YcfA-like protein [Moorella thermoacetica]
MTRFAIISAEDMERILIHLGFERKRQVGSHVMFAHPDGRCTVVPFHKGEDLARGLIRKILRDVDISLEEYEKLRQEIL